MSKFFFPAVCATITALVLKPAFALPGNAKSVNNPFSQINAEMTLIKSDVASLHDEINQLIGSVNSLQEKVGANTAAISALQQRDVYLEGLLAQANLDIAAVMAAIDELRQQNTDLQARVDANASNIGELKAKIAYNLGLMDLLAQAIDTVEQKSIDMHDSLQQQVAYNLSLIQYVQSDITAINHMLELQQNLNAGKCPDGSAVQEIKSDGSYVCVQVSGGSGILRVYSKTEYKNMGANETISLALYCDDGDVATGAGHFGYENIDVMSNFAQNFTYNGLNYGYGYINSTNANSYSVFSGVVVNCLDTTP